MKEYSIGTKCVQAGYAAGNGITFAHMYFNCITLDVVLQTIGIFQRSTAFLFLQPDFILENNLTISLKM